MKTDNKMNNERIDKALQRAFEKKMEFKDLMYIFLGEVAFFTIIATAIFF